MLRVEVESHLTEPIKILCICHFTADKFACYITLMDRLNDLQMTINISGYQNNSLLTGLSCLEGTRLWLVPSPPIQRKMASFPAKENPNMEKVLFDWPIVLQYFIKAKVSRKLSGNQPKATHACIRSINQSNRSTSVSLLFLFCWHLLFQGHTKIALTYTDISVKSFCRYDGCTY